MDTRKNVVTNGMWAILALVLYQGMLQFVAYPCINKSFGVEKFGNVLYITALLNILALAVGNSVGNVKLMAGKDSGGQNGDFLVSIGLQVALVTIVFVLLCKNYVSGTTNWVLLVFTLCLMALRSYGEASYRISLNFRGYFFYYLLLSAGYLLGLSVLLFSENWILCFLMGELFCTILLAAKDKLFWPLSLSDRWKTVAKQSITLAGAYLLNYAIGFLDRILLQAWVDSTAVSIYYVSSLLGKIIIMLVVPLNNVLLSYLAKQENAITMRHYLMVFLSLICLGGILYGGVMVVSPIFIQLFYPELYEPVFQILWIVSLSQIFCAVTSTLLTILLKICGVKWQFRFQLFYFLQFILLSFSGVRWMGVAGFAVGGMIANVFQLVLVLGSGLLFVKNNLNKEGRLQK